MSSNYSGLPAAGVVNELCHNNSSFKSITETSIAAFAFAFLLFSLCTAQAVVVEIYSFISGSGFSIGSHTSLEEWFFSTATFVAVSASALVLLALFVKIYLRSTYGAPFFSTELQTDLSYEQALNYSEAYMAGLGEEGTISVDETNGRLVCLMRETNFASTYLDLRIVELEDDRSLVCVRSVSIPYGRPALLSSYYNDMGAARLIVDGVRDLFSAQQSQTRTAVKKAANTQNRPSKNVFNSCPPPMLTRPAQRPF